MIKAGILLILLTALFFLLPVSIFCQESGENPEWKLDSVIPLDPEIAFGKLENGLTYYIKHNSTPENRAELRLGVKVGSVLEDDNQQGIAHYLEHMAFNGTENFVKNDLVQYLESIGMRFGPDINAYTSFDQTVYELKIPLDDPLIVEMALVILLDWAQGIIFDPVEVEKERGVVREEWRLGRGADARMRDRQFPILFHDSKYGERLPIGKVEQIDSFQPDDFQRFYEDWYRPELMAVVAVGDFDVEAMETIIKRYFSVLKNPDAPRERIQVPVPDHKETLVATATDPEADLSTVSLYFKRDIEPELTYSDYRVMMMQRLFSSMLNQRFQEITKGADPPFLYAVTGYSTFVRTKGFYYLTAVVPEDGIQRGLQALVTEVNRAREHGFGDPELERAKLQTKRFIDVLFNEQDKSDSGPFADEYLRNFFEAEFVPGISTEHKLHNTYLPGITADEVNQHVEGWLANHSRVVLVNAPEKPESLLPTDGEILAMLGEAEQMAVTSYVDDVVVAPLVQNKPTGGRVTAEQRFEDVQVVEWSLSNGVRVVIKPTEFKNDEIRFTAFSPGGTSLVSDAEYLSASLATTIVREGGVGEFSASQLQKALAGSTATVDPYIDELWEGLAGRSAPRDLETLMQLIWLYVTDPGESRTAFDSYITRMKGFIENRRAQPDSVFNDAVQGLMGDNHPRRRPLTIGSLADVRFETAHRIYRQRFADVSDMVFVFVGNINLDTFKPLVETYLSNLPGGGRNERWRDLGIKPPEKVTSSTVSMGIEPKSSVALVFHGDYQWSVENQYRLHSFADVLRIKLRENLREDLGGTYGVRIWTRAIRYPEQRYLLYISFSCDPARTEELIRAVFQELEWMKIMVEDDYIQRVGEGQKRKFETESKSNEFWIDELRDTYINEKSPSDIDDYGELVEGLDAPLLESAAREFINFERYLKVILMPES